VLSRTEFPFYSEHLGELAAIGAGDRHLSTSHLNPGDGKSSVDVRLPPKAHAEADIPPDRSVLVLIYFVFVLIVLFSARWAHINHATGKVCWVLTRDGCPVGCHRGTLGVTAMERCSLASQRRSTGFWPRLGRMMRRFLSRVRNRLSRLRARGDRREGSAVCGARRAIPTGAKLNVGCGGAAGEGYLGCDVRPLPSIDLVCPAWEVSKYCGDLGEIYSRHMVEHLTFAEAEATLNDWYKALRVGGEIHVMVPNLEFHIDQFRRAVWSEESLKEKWSDASWGFAGFYGWQRQCDPRAADYERSYWDVHKSGYTPSLLRFMLERAGFAEVAVSVQDNVHLVGRGKKLCATSVPVDT